MEAFFRKKAAFLLLTVCLAGLIGSVAYLVLSSESLTGLNNLAPMSKATSPTKVAKQSRGCMLTQHGFEGGVVFPRWSNKAYGSNDTNWVQELPQMKTQTAACWVEMPVLFQQTSLTSTDVAPGKNTPTLSSFTSGIHYARAQGLHVFVTMLVTIPTGIEHWAGQIKFTTAAQEQQWFTNYWQTIQPYVAAAQQAGVEQLALGTEEQWLQDHAPASLWNTLISKIHHVFSGTLTYDVNWTALKENPPAWLHNPLLKVIGVSAYAPILTTSKRVDPQQMPALWSKDVQSLLDQFSTKLGAPIIISEIGYRSTADAFYNPWLTKSSAATDLQEQQGACAAVLVNALSDSHILGSFFWAWDGSGKLNLKNSLAASALHQYYQPLSAPV